MHTDITQIAKEVGYELIALCYPFYFSAKQYTIPLYPRLKGDMIWSLLEGPFWGVVKAWQMRRRALARKTVGVIP
jgi:hypothetical protein